MARFKIFVDGEVSLYDILDDQCTVGRGRSNSIRVDAEGIADTLARVSCEGGRVFIAPIAGVALRVDGEVVDTRCRLWHGSRVELGAAAALEFVDPAARRPALQPAQGAQPVAPAIPAAPSSGATPREIVVPSVASERRDRAQRRERVAGRQRPIDRPGARPAWHLFSGLILLALTLVWISIRLATGAGGGQSAPDLLALAETQHARGNLQLALRTAETAAARAEGDAALSAAIEAFATKTRAALQRASDIEDLDLARHAAENLRVFERAYLIAEPTHRAACRELVRLADRWLGRYRAVCERHDEGRAMVATVADLRARYAPAAALEEPENVEDVLFAALRATRLKRPRYREALERLDEYLARRGPDADVARARAYRDEQERAGREWLDGQIRLLRREWERGRTDTVLTELRYLIDENVPTAWCAELEALDRTWRAEAGR